MDEGKIISPWHTDTAASHTDKVEAGHTDVITGPHTDVKGHNDVPQVHADVSTPHTDHTDKPI